MSPPGSRECPDRVAICAHQLALRYLIKDLLAGATPEVRADVAELERPRQVIPLHHLGRKNSTAVGAWESTLETEEPFVPTSLPYAGWHARSADPLVSSVVDQGPAALAVALQAIAAVLILVELRESLELATSRTAFHSYSPSVRYQHRYRHGLARRGALRIGCVTMPM